MLRRRLLLTLVAALTVAVAGTSLIRTVRNFYRLDFVVSWVAAGLVVEGVPEGSSAAAAGLRPGDTIVGVEGVSIDRLDDPAFFLAGGDEHDLEVRHANGSVARIRFRSPPPAINSVYLARTTVGLASLALALSTVWRTRRREAATFLLLAAAALVMGAVPNRTATAELTLQVVRRAAGAALPFLIARFFLIFPERERSMRTLDIVMLAAIACSGGTALVRGAEAWWPAVASLLRALFTSSVLFGIVIQIWRWRVAAREARTRRQIEWEALGLIVGLTPFLALVAVPNWFGIGFEPFTWMAVLPIVAVPLSLSAALFEYRLWDLEPIARDSLSATLVVVMGGFIFVLTNHVLLRYVGGLGSLRNLFAFATGVLLVVLLQPVRLQVERYLDQWLHHGRPAPRVLLASASRDLARVTDPRELLVLLSHTLNQGLEFDLVATYLRMSGEVFERVTGSEDAAPDLLPGAVVNDPYPGLPEQPLARAGYTVRIPLERAGTVHGLLYLGLRRGVFPLGSEGEEVVAAFAAQAALALESARYLDDLRRQAEEYRILHTNTQRIIESSAAAILVCDASAHILTANRHAAGIFERQAQSLVGLALGDLVDLPEAWRRELPLHAVNTEARTLSDPPRHVILAVSVLELDSGSFNGRVVVLQDVTELRDLQDRIREQERLAGLGRLASGLAHEINTPLTGISSFAQMLGQMTPGDDPRAELVDKLVDQSFRVSRIVSNLRAMVRGSTDSRTVLELRGLATRAAEDAARSLGAEGVLEIDAAESPVMVWGSVAPIELAISNLVRNAIEASPSGQPIVMSILADGGWAEIRIEDSGTGLSDAGVEKAFEPFYTTKTDRGGTGLGLAITRDMIAQLGGSVSLANRDEGGARATIRLQRWQEPVQSS